MEILSYGGGIQSFAILLLILNGRVRVQEDFSIVHVDMSPYEPKTQQHIADVVLPLVGNQYRFITLNGGNALREKLHSGITMTPYWHKSGLHVQRLCTIRYKIDIVDRIIPRYAWATMTLGISVDEIRRIQRHDTRLSRGRMKSYRYPLIELDMTRSDCIEYIRSCGFEPPPKSACYVCPFSSKRRILENLIEIPQMYAEIKAIERAWADRGNYARYLTQYRENLPTPHEAIAMLAALDSADDGGHECKSCMV